jgi:threonine dehydratase
MNPLRDLTPAALAELTDQAVERVAGYALRTPLVRLPLESGPAEIYCKLECLQPIGSFKLRGAASALSAVPRAELQQGVVTASAGNMAQGVAWVARELGVPCDVVIPEGAPDNKRQAIERLGGRLTEVPYATWWKTLEERGFDGLDGYFVHPVCDPAVIAGNGTIGLEILEDLPDVQTVVVPYGGGGLITGIASAIKARRPDVRVIAAEVETAAPLTAAMAAGEPVPIEHTRSFVDGIGGKTVLEDMWPLVQTLVDATAVVSLEQIGAAMRMLLGRCHILAEGAGAASLAAALTGKAALGKVACVISGGNVDLPVLAKILRAELP